MMPSDCSEGVSERQWWRPGHVRTGYWLEVTIRMVLMMCCYRIMQCRAKLHVQTEHWPEYHHPWLEFYLCCINRLSILLLSQVATYILVSSGRTSRLTNDMEMVLSWCNSWVFVAKLQVFCGSEMNFLFLFNMVLLTILWLTIYQTKICISTSNFS